jgi:hypothetical protein
MTEKPVNLSKPPPPPPKPLTKKAALAEWLEAVDALLEQFSGG